MTAGEERTRAAEVRAGVRRPGTVLSIVFFLLTSIAIVAAALLLHALATGILCIVVAEIWMRAKAQGRAESGVVAALWLGGLFALIFALPHSGKPEGLLLLGAACAVAGARVRNPIIGAIASGLVVAYLAEIQAHEPALMAGVVIAAIALVLLAREWRRPSTELLFITLTIVAPLAGAITVRDRVPVVWSLAYIVLALAGLAFAIQKRHHASFYAAAASLAIAAIMLRDVVPLAAEWKLILAGALLFALSVAISRALRGKTSGFVMTPFRDSAEQALRLFGTVALAPNTENTAPASPQPPGGGGSFGGAGASGKF